MVLSCCITGCQHWCNGSRLQGLVSVLSMLHSAALCEKEGWRGDRCPTTTATADICHRQRKRVSATHSGTLSTYPQPSLWHSSPTRHTATHNCKHAVFSFGRSAVTHTPGAETGVEQQSPVRVSAGVPTSHTVNSALVSCIFWCIPLPSATKCSHALPYKVQLQHLQS